MSNPFTLEEMRSSLEPFSIEIERSLNRVITKPFSVSISDLMRSGLILLSSMSLSVSTISSELKSNERLISVRNFSIASGNVATSLTSISLSAALR